MFFELIATFAAGIAAAGVMLGLSHLFRGRFPRWLIPAAAGLAMIGYTIWSEMTWADRTIASFPDRLAVVSRVDETIAWKPWTFAVPQTTRLIALDTGSARENEAAPGVQLVDLYLYQRWQPPGRVQQLVDCGEGARADPTEAALEDPANATWHDIEPESDLLATACPDIAKGNGDGT